MCIGLALPIAIATGCSGPDFEPRTLVNRMRVIAVRAEPPYFGFSKPVQLQMKVVGLPSDRPLCHAWALCLFTRNDQGNLTCFDPDLQVDLGTAPEATLELQHFLTAFGKLPAVLEKYGMAELSQPGTGEPGAPKACDEGERPAPFPEVFVLFKVAERDAMGGTCPATAAAMLEGICQDRTRCIAGFKPLLLAVKTVTRLVDGACQTTQVPDPYKQHHNPVLEGLQLDGVDWPQALTPTLAPAGGAAGTSTAFGSDDTRGVELLPVLAEGSMEVTGKSLEAGLPDPTEQIVYSWLSEAGDFTYGRSSHVAPDTRYLPAPPAGGASEQDVGLWLVARDGRGGVSWTRRNVKVRPQSGGGGHPLCALDAGLEGCPK